MSRTWSSAVPSNQSKRRENENRERRRRAAATRVSSWAEMIVVAATATQIALAGFAGDRAYDAPQHVDVGHTGTQDQIFETIAAAPEMPAIGTDRDFTFLSINRVVHATQVDRSKLSLRKPDKFQHNL